MPELFSISVRGRGWGKLGQSRRTECLRGNTHQWPPTQLANTVRGPGHPLHLDPAAIAAVEAAVKGQDQTQEKKIKEKKKETGWDLGAPYLNGSGRIPRTLQSC